MTAPKRYKLGTLDMHSTCWAITDKTSKSMRLNLAVMRRYADIAQGLIEATPGTRGREACEAT